MNTLLTILLITHIATGFTALLVGLIPMFATKGSQLHNRAGLVFVYCMIAVTLTALLLCVLQPFKMMRLFLTGIAVFSFYLSMTGWRATKQKNGQVAAFDHWLTYITLAVSAGMIGFGVYLLVLNGPVFLPIVFTFFGFLTLRFAVEDYRKQRRPAQKMHRRVAPWYFQHFTRMGGAYIASFTAALVTNIGRVLPDDAPDWVGTVAWIAPSILGGLIIGRTVRYYLTKFKLTR
ncbi:DUF2306 domain-containing protein [Spirosoma montaniterrae]|uniref:DUF2306 domain-containing protein n=1 Tax=Spirosoma montaniterrae TaxID=1178516 RepID=A0A1P9X4X5_9BACT|nr:DUF2306 domain-containing protein [Spirosoma montaniterrae]AQG82686.1 hypothetical protein AWR27_24470 [Spirosoma montaniterrae]